MNNVVKKRPDDVLGLALSGATVFDLGAGLFYGPLYCKKSQQEALTEPAMAEVNKRLYPVWVRLDMVVLLDEG